MTSLETAQFPRAPFSILGMAALVELAYRQGDVGAIWNELLARYQADPLDAAALMDLSVILQTAGLHDKGLELQRHALALNRCYVRATRSRDGLRVLAFAAAGDFRTNTPVDFLMKGSRATLTTYYVDAETRDLQDAPPHDVAFIAVGEAEANAGVLANLERLLHGWPRPVMNGAPRRIAALTRDGVAAALAGEAAIVAPKTVRADRAALQKLALGRLGLDALLGQANFPVIARPLASQGGEGLAKIDGPAAMAAYLDQQPAEPHFFLAPFVDYRSPDGFFRKRRIAFIDGRPFPSHLAVSDHWVVHYLSSGMQQNDAWRAEEAAWMAGFDAGFGLRHKQALDALARTIALDYFAIDCAETPEGRLLLFEAQVAMIVHDMDATGVFSYKEAPMRNLFAAFQSALQRRCGLLS